MNGKHPQKLKSPQLPKLTTCLIPPCENSIKYKTFAVGYTILFRLGSFHDTVPYFSYRLILFSHGWPDWKKYSSWELILLLRNILKHKHCFHPPFLTIDYTDLSESGTWLSFWLTPPPSQQRAHLFSTTCGCRETIKAPNISHWSSAHLIGPIHRSIGVYYWTGAAKVHWGIFNQECLAFCQLSLENQVFGALCDFLTLEEQRWT